MSSIRSVLPWLLVVLALALAPAGLHADDDGPSDPPPPPEADDGEGENGEGENGEAEDGEEAPAEPVVEAKEERATLHKVYVPFRELSKVFEKEGEGVFLPYEEFLSLWRRAHGPEATTEGPPVKATVRAASYRGEAAGQMVSLTAKLEVEVLADGWQRIPLDFAGAGIEKATVDGEPALLLPAPKGYELLLKDAGRRSLELELRIAVARKGDQHSAKFALPPVPLSRLVLSVPGSATKVDVTPRLASSTQSADDGRTELLAFLGPVSNIQITWHQRVDEGPSVEPLVFADESHDIRADRGVLRSELVADLSVLRAPLEAVQVRVPADVVTLYVQGDGIRTWERSEDGTSIRVALREPVKESWQLRLGLERPLPDLPADVVLPLAAVEGVERETGFVRLLMGEGVKLEPTDTPGLLQIDVTELPEALKGAPPGRALAYRFPARPGPSTVRIEALRPRLTVATGTRIDLRPEGTNVAYGAQLGVERAGIFGVTYDLPADLEVTAVKVEGVEYDDHKVRTEDGKRILTVEFRDRLLGGARLTVEGRLPPALPADEDDDREVTLAVPLLSLRDADQVSGYLAVHVDSALEHRVTTKAGLVVLDQGAAAVYEPPMVQTPLAYRFSYHEGEIALSLALKRRAPAVTAQVETFVRLAPDRTRMGAVLRYFVRYRGVDTFRFTAPMSLAPLMHVDLEGVELIGPEPLEGEEGNGARGVWTIKLPSPRTGAIPLPLDIEDVPPERVLNSGDRRVDAVPSFVPLAEGESPLPNTSHFTAVRRDPLLEVSVEDLTRGEEIDARELPPALQAEENFLAFRAWDPKWSCRVLVTRHDYEPVAEVVVSHMHLDTVLAKDGRATTEAYLVVRNNDRQYLELELPPNATIRAVTVDGKSRPPRSGEDEKVLVPLRTGLAKDEAFVVALAFDHDVERASFLLFDTTTVKSPAPQRVTADLLTWRVFAPAEETWTKLGGSLEPADPEWSWFARLVDGLSSMVGASEPGANAHVAHVAGGFKSPFATRHEGRAFLFSNRVGTGHVSLTSADPEGFTFWWLLWLAVALVLTIVLLPIAGRSGLGEGRLFAAALLVLLVLLVRASPGAAAVLNAMLVGLLLAGVGRLVVLGLRAHRLRRAEAPSEPPASPAGGGEPEPAPEGGAA